MYIKVKLCPIWKLNVIEKWLENQEKLGFNLLKVKFGMLFYFKCGTSKKVKYFFTINKVRGITMDNISYSLLTEFKSTEIPSIYSILCLYKVKTIEKKDYEFINDIRNSFILSYIKEYLLCGILLFILSLILNCYNANTITIILNIFSSLLSIYYLIGYMLQKSK